MRISDWSSDVCSSDLKVYEQIVAAVAIPVLHIADAVGERMRADGIKNAALIGTRNVMTERFYRQRLVAHGISLVPPDLERANEIDRIIYEELARGKATRMSERTMKTYLTRSEEHTSELQSLMRISYAVFCLK